jgi:hypothetical protein
MFQKPLEIAQRYFNAWNQHDAGAIVATFAENGIYSDPVTPGPLTGAAIRVSRSFLRHRQLRRE